MFPYASLTITCNIISAILGYILYTRHMDPLCIFSLHHQPYYLTALNTTVMEIKAILQFQLLLAQQLNDTSLCFKLSGS